MDLENLETIEDWGKWKSTLHKVAQAGETVGMSEENISKIAKVVGTFLANHVDPENDEQRTIKEFWDAANEEERKTLAKLMVKIVN